MPDSRRDSEGATQQASPLLNAKKTQRLGSNLRFEGSLDVETPAVIFDSYRD